MLTLFYCVKVIGVRGLDEELYRRVEAAAALRGVRVGDAFGEALKLWLSVKPELVGGWRRSRGELR